MINVQTNNQSNTQAVEFDMNREKAVGEALRYW
jgi:hypothetical protein